VLAIKKRLSPKAGSVDMLIECIRSLIVRRRQLSTRRNFYAWVAGIAVLVALNVWFVPDATCADGWESGSIGRRGACSWHGGVRSSPWGFAALIASVIVGVLIAKFEEISDWFTGWRKRRRAEKQAPSSKKQRILTPYGTLEQYETLLRQRGADPDQIQVELSKYYSTPPPNNSVDR
jgi:hypothetical protein